VEAVSVGNEVIICNSCN